MPAAVKGGFESVDETFREEFFQDYSGRFGFGFLQFVGAGVEVEVLVQFGDDFGEEFVFDILRRTAVKE